MTAKSTVEEIRARFDADVERFSNLETGQTSTMDAALAMQLVAETAARVTPQARHVVDVGCGAGNYTLALLQRRPGLEATLIDLSRPMLDRAVARVSAATTGRVTARQGDIRELELAPESTDIILASAVLHHLRTEEEWAAVFRKFHAALRPGGGVWIFDLVAHEYPGVQALMWERYGAYLSALRDEAYRDHVFAYVDREDTPRSVTFQLQQLHAAGFGTVDVLHKTACFAAFGAVKG
jgi:tRNA (cmo5U34)-methyltransferase